MTAFIDSIHKYFPDEAKGYLEVLRDKPYCGIRANTLKITPNELKRIMGAELTPVPWCNEGFYYDADIYKPAKSPFYRAGLFYIQEPAAQSAVSAFDIKPGDKVLDICAAPGGKTSQIAAKLGGEGVIVANDANAKRCGALIFNIELCGITNAVITNETPERLSKTFGRYFDKILVDAPCSGEGMFRKDSTAAAAYTKYKSVRLAAIQSDILYHAERMLKPGGEIMYSTCTFSPIENEMVIGKFLDAFKDYKVRPINYPFDNGDPTFYAPFHNEIKNTVRLWPHKHNCEGHFLARLAKVGDSITAEQNKQTKTPLPFKRFCEDNLNKDWNGCIFTSFGQRLYITPRGLPSFDGLKVLRPGFYAGDIRNDKFKPSHALAMGISKKDAKHTLDYTKDDNDLYRFFKGESIDALCADGFCLICAGEYPVGFGIALNGRLKNNYPKNFVMQ